MFFDEGAGFLDGVGLFASDYRFTFADGQERLDLGQGLGVDVRFDVFHGDFHSAGDFLGEFVDVVFEFGEFGFHIIEYVSIGCHDEAGDQKNGWPHFLFEFSKLLVE